MEMIVDKRMMPEAVRLIYDIVCAGIGCIKVILACQICVAWTKVGVEVVLKDA